MVKNKHLNPIWSGAALCTFSLDWIREYIMSKPIVSTIVFILFLILFVIGLSDRVSKYLATTAKKNKWRILSFYYILPIIIISISFGLFISQFRSYRKITPEHKLETIYNKTFQNESVVLDGKKFMNCSFEGVTFIWSGDNFAMEGGTKIASYQKIRINEPIARKIVQLTLKLYYPEKNFDFQYFDSRKGY